MSLSLCAWTPSLIFQVQCTPCKPCAHTGGAVSSLSRAAVQEAHTALETDSGDGILELLMGMFPRPHKPHEKGHGWMMGSNPHRCPAHFLSMCWFLPFFIALLLFQQPAHPSGYGFYRPHLLILVLIPLFRLNLPSFLCSRCAFKGSMCYLCLSPSLIKLQAS